MAVKLLGDLASIDEEATHNQDTYQAKIEKVLEAFDWVEELTSKKYKPPKSDAIDATEVET